MKDNGNFSFLANQTGKFSSLWHHGKHSYTQDEYIQLSRLIDLLTWAPSCLVFFNCHNSALNYNIYLLNSSMSKVKKICIYRNYYDLYVLSRGGTTRWCRVQNLTCCSTGSRHQISLTDEGDIIEFSVFY
jgi:hypothetical protein